MGHLNCRSLTLGWSPSADVGLPLGRSPLQYRHHMVSGGRIERHHFLSGVASFRIILAIFSLQADHPFSTTLIKARYRDSKNLREIATPTAAQPLSENEHSRRTPPISNHGLHSTRLEISLTCTVEDPVSLFPEEDQSTSKHVIFNITEPGLHITPLLYEKMQRQAPSPSPAA